MPRSTLSEADLPPEQQQRLRQARQRVTEHQKDPTQLTIEERVKRLEILMGVEG